MDNASHIGAHTVLFNNVSLTQSTVNAYSYIQSNSIIYNTHIGKFCSIASYANIGLGGHPMQMVSTSPVFYDNTQPLPKFLTNTKTSTEESKQTKIEADVWVGHGVIIKAGVTVGVGAIIGAGAVVTKDVPPYAIAAGNPCKIIRMRFSEEIIQRLLTSQWWELEDTKLASMSHLFVEPTQLLKVLEQN